MPSSTLNHISFICDLSAERSPPSMTWLVLNRLNPPPNTHTHFAVLDRKHKQDMYQDPGKWLGYTQFATGLVS